MWDVVVEELCTSTASNRAEERGSSQRDPRILVHLESGSDVVIVHGTAVDIGHPIEHPELVGHCEDKYNKPEVSLDLPLSDLCFDVTYQLEPSRAIAWALPDTEASTARWWADA